MIATEGPYCPYIHAASQDNRQRPWTVKQRVLAHYLLVCSLRGEEYIRVAGQDYHVPAGATYLVCPGQLADLGSLRGSQPGWIHFDVRWDPERTRHPHAMAYDSELGPRARFLQPAPKEVWGVDLPVLVPDPLRAVFVSQVPRIIEHWKRHDPLSLLEANTGLSSLLLTWVAYEWRRSQRGRNVGLEERVARAESLALQSLDRGFGVKQFAAAARLSRTRFSVVYRQLRGFPPGEFLRRERLRRAEALLARPSLTVAEVGALAGYPDPTVFGRVFRRAHGVTPSVWRMRQVQGG